jgi:hypothetical protein
MPRIGTIYNSTANQYIPFTISLNDLRNEYGRKSRAGTDISFLDYYRGNGLVPDTTLNSVASKINTADYLPLARYNVAYSPDTFLPNSGELSLNVFRDSTRYRQTQTSMGDTSKPLMYGAHTTSGGNAGMPGDVWIGRGDTAPFQLLYRINLSNKWFPLLPTLVNDTNNRNQYCLGTANHTNSYTIADVPIFAWRSEYSRWTDKMMSATLGLTTSQIARSKRARRVWWDSVYTGMDAGVSYGFAVLKYNNFNALAEADPAGGYGTAIEQQYSNPWAQAIDLGGGTYPIFSNYDWETEWHDHGFTYKPTVTYSNPWTNSAGIGTYTLTNTGSAAITRTGATYRDSGGLLSTRSDYSITIGNEDLVVPIIKSDNGFSGGPSGLSKNIIGTRYPLVATFGLIEVIQEVATY